MKTCTKCQVPQQLEVFGRRADSQDGLNSQCKDCRRKDRRRWKIANPEKVRISKRKWRKAYPEKTNAHARKYRAANVEKARQRVRDWKRANPELKRRAEHRREARKVSNGIFNVTAREMALMLSRPCYLCGVAPSTDFEHIIPSSKGGRWSIGNLLGACGPCNSSKGTKFLIECRQ